MMIKQDIAPRIHEYLGGIVRNKGGVAFAIGGMPDHVHLLFRWKTDDSLSNLMRDIKCNSSRWIHEALPDMTSFAWQDGFGAFTVSQSQKETVERYIVNQGAHHRGRSYQDEYVDLLKAHQVEYDERFLWD
jgi:REP element-mobilizing transposase RayT